MTADQNAQITEYRVGEEQFAEREELRKLTESQLIVSFFPNNKEAEALMVVIDAIASKFNETQKKIKGLEEQRNYLLIQKVESYIPMSEEINAEKESLAGFLVDLVEAGNLEVKEGLIEEIQRFEIKAI